MDIKGFKDRCGNVHKYDYGSLANIPDNSTVTDQQIAAAIEKYLTENPVEGVTDQQVYDAVAAYLAENPVEGVTDEQIAQAVADYLTENPVEVTGVVKSVNGVGPDANGNVAITIPDSTQNGDGLTTTEKNLILSLFKNAAYTADMSATIAQLETLWSGENSVDDSGNGDDSGGSEDAGGSGGDTEATGDENVVVTGATATDDGNGNVTVIGLTATDDGNGNITVF